MLIRQIVASAILATGFDIALAFNVALIFLGWLSVAIGLGIIAGTVMDRMGRGPRIIDLGQTHSGSIAHD